MPKGLEKDIHNAKEIAIKYLSRTPRSTMEVERKLQEKGIAGDIIKETTHYLMNLGYLNDEAFAREWAGSRRKNRLWGRIRIINGLKQKGISDELIRNVVYTFTTDTIELQTAKTALKKWFKTKGKIVSRMKDDRRAIAQKAFRHLMAKGFPTSIIMTAIKENYGELEADESS